MGALGEWSGWDLRVRLAAGNLGTWKSGIWRSGDLEIQKLGIQKINKTNIEIQIRSAQNVGKVWISRKHPPGPFWSHLRPFFPWTRKIKKCYILSVFLGGPMGPIHPVWALAAIHPRWGNRLDLSRRQRLLQRCFLFLLFGDVYNQGSTE